MDHFPYKLLANRDFSFFYACSGMAGSAITYAFGGWSGILEILFLFFIVDYISGCFASIKEGKGLRSTLGFWGLLKKGLMLLIVLIGHRIDVALGLNFVMSGVIYFWLSNELVSILENYSRLGMRTPDALTKVLAILQDKGSTGHDQQTK